MAEIRHARKKIIVNPRLQGRLLRDCCTAPLVALVGGALIVGFLLRMVRAEAGSMEMELPTLTDLTIAMVLFVAICCIVIVYHAIQFSHRIAGPLYRFHKSIDEVLSGESNLSVSLRRFDYMHDTAEHFNKLVAYVGARESELQRLHALLAQHNIDAGIAPAPPTTSSPGDFAPTSAADGFETEHADATEHASPETQQSTTAP